MTGHFLVRESQMTHQLNCCQHCAPALVISAKLQQISHVGAGLKPSPMQMSWQHSRAVDFGRWCQHSRAVSSHHFIKLSFLSCRLLSHSESHCSELYVPSVGACFADTVQAAGAGALGRAATCPV